MDKPPAKDINFGEEDGTMSDESEAGPETETLEGPAKAVFHTVGMTLNARLAFVDFGGLHDQRSLQNLIPVINPRKLILFGGSESETQTLALDCKTLLAAKEGELSGEPTVDIFTPLVGQIIDASVDTSAWTVKLSRDLVKRLQWQSVHKMGVVTLTGELRGEQPSAQHFDAATIKNKKQKLLKPDPEGEHTAAESRIGLTEIHPVLDLVPMAAAAAIRSIAQPLHVGDLRLADLRRLMGNMGYTAEFRGEGTLLIDGNVAVRKLGMGKIVVEGSLYGSVMLSTSRPTNTFYDVRKTIYEGLAVIGGG